MTIAADQSSTFATSSRLLHAVGASAAPAAPASGSDAPPAAGTSDTMFVGAAAAPTPDEGSAAAYAASAHPDTAPAAPTPAAYGSATPEPVTGGGAVATAASPVTAAAATTSAGTNGWSSLYEQRFQALQLAPADIAYLRTAGYDAPTLDAIAAELAQVDVLGTPTGASGPSTAPDPTQATGVDQVGQTGQAGQVDAQAAPGWSRAWEARFTDLLHAMGRPEAEIREQVQAAATSGLTDAQLQTAYDGMRQSLGDFSPQWHAKFSAVLTKLGATPEQRDQTLQQLASTGLDTKGLQAAYDKLVAQAPGWSTDWKQKFSKLDIPEELMTQLKDAKLSGEALHQQYDRLSGIRKEFQDDGRLKKLEDAKATPAEKWGVMTQGLKGKEFDKVQDQIRSSHVPLWKRIVSFGVNLIPGAFALEYIFGGDPITGDKVDRTNPLNIIGAVASGFAAFTAIRGAVGVVQGLVAANSAVKATQAVAGVANIGEAVAAAGSASKIGAGTLQAMQGVGLVEKFSTGLKLMDYVKAVTPVVNKFGEAKALAQFGAGYSQAMQFAATTAALTKTATGTVIDQGVRATVLDTMRSGGSVSDALGKVQRSAGGARPVFTTAEVAKMSNNTGMLQQTGLWNFNPFKNNSTVSVTHMENGTNVAMLGKGVNLASKGGVAQLVGNLRAADQAALPDAIRGSATAAALRVGMPTTANLSDEAIAATNAVNDASVAANGLETTLVAKWAKNLGVVDGGGFRSLLQLGSSNRAAAGAVRTVENTGNGTKNLVSWIAGLPARDKLIIPSLGFGVATGTVGHQLQGVWEAVEEDPGVVIGQSKYKEADAQRLADAKAEQERYAAEYAAQQANAQGAAQPVGAAPVGQ
ncbi:MAG: hypothetical protein JWN72_2222 [Thermoleophilia bacterium]|nr:hypothetical protein [Thermoleophilia bacterium]